MCKQRTSQAEKHKRISSKRDSLRAYILKILFQHFQMEIKVFIFSLCLNFGKDGWKISKLSWLKVTLNCSIKKKQNYFIIYELKKLQKIIEWKENYLFKKIWNRKKKKFKWKFSCAVHTKLETKIKDKSVWKRVWKAVRILLRFLWHAKKSWPQMVKSTQAKDTKQHKNH